MSLLGPATKKGKKFQNAVPTRLSTGGFGGTLLEYMRNKAEVVPKRPLGPFKTDVSIFNTPPASGLRITWLGHSSLLIEMDGKRILTDPVWGRASFLTSIGPKRFFPAPIRLEDLPPIDVVLISHDHFDHLDATVIPFLAKKDLIFICPLGVKKILKKWGASPELITEMDWGDSFKLTADFMITAMPARHFSGRSLLNRNETLWASYILKGQKHNIYHGADSGYFEGFKEIGQTYGPFDLCLLEIGASHPNWADIHMGPAGAAKAFADLNAALLMPIHWGTFNLALHAWDEPVLTMISLAKAQSIPLFLPVPGVPTEVLPGREVISGWWKGS